MSTRKTLDKAIKAMDAGFEEGLLEHNLSLFEDMLKMYRRHEARLASGKVTETEKMLLPKNMKNNLLNAEKQAKYIRSKMKAAEYKSKAKPALERALSKYNLAGNVKIP